MISEKLRQGFKETVDEVFKDRPEKVKSMLTQLCYECYKMGLKDNIDGMIKLLEDLKKGLDK